MALLWAGTAEAQFTNVTASSGAINVGGTKDGGLAWADWNNDTCLDLAVNTSSAAVGSRLLMQDVSGGSCAGTFTDVTACLAPGLTSAALERAMVWADFDADGDLDFARNDNTAVEVYLNNGPGPGPGGGCPAWSVFGSAGAPSQVFNATTNPPAQTVFNTEGMGWIDYDGDGDLDLIADNHDGGVQLFRNDGGSSLVHADPTPAGLPTAGGGNGDYAAFGDIDDDGDVDVLLRKSATPDLLLNGGGTFTNPDPAVAPNVGFDQVASNGNKGGVAMCDFDDDGDLDVFWTDNDPNQIWEQTAPGVFAARGVPVGINTAGGGVDGVACGDVDNDGDLDLMLGGGAADQLFRNDGGFSFTDISPANFGLGNSEGVAFGDYDNDGDLDLTINRSTNELWRNDTNTSTYLMVDALYVQGGVSRPAIGATLRLLDCTGAPISGLREVNGGRGHGSQDPARVHFGIPSTGGRDENTPVVIRVSYVSVGGARSTVLKAVVPSALGTYQLASVASNEAIDMAACGVTAVELVSFEAVPGDGRVDLRWETGSEVDNLGFHLYRAMAPEGPWERLTRTLIPGLGSSPEGARYSYLDPGLSNGVTYFYQLEDVETTGYTERHGPVSATPFPGGGVGLDPTGEEDEPEDPAPEARAWVAYGDPEATSLRVVKRGPRHAVLELETGGFYAFAGENGSVWLSIPGFEEADEPGAPALPVRLTWLEAVAGRKVRLATVVARGVRAFTGLRPEVTGEHELFQDEGGLLVAGRRRRAAGAAFGGPGLYPEKAARILGTAFQGDVKKAQLALSPLRWDRSSGRLLLARRLRVTVVFAGPESGEHSRGGRYGRRPRRRGRCRPAEGVVARLAVRDPGLYAVRFEELFAGRRVRPSDLALSRQGEPVAFHVEPAGRRFGRGSVLYFASEGAALNPHGPEAVYELSLSGDGTRMPVQSVTPHGALVPHYWQLEQQEVNRLYQPTLLTTENLWYWDYLPSHELKSYSFPVDALAGTSEPARLQVWLHGGSDYPADPDHHLAVSVNGYRVGEASWDGKQPYLLEADVDHGILRDGENTLEIENLGDTGAANSLAILDRFDLTYPRRLVASAQELQGRFGQGGVAQIQGLGAGSRVLDTTEPVPRWLIGAWAAPRGLSFRVESGRRYLAVSPEAVRRPEVRPARASNLRDPRRRADYLIIGPREYLNAARPLLAQRRHQGLESDAVAIEDVFDEFGHGEGHPEALRSFLGHAYHSWRKAPRYVLLLGDATYDFKGYLGTGIENQVPPFIVRDPYLWTVSDPAYASVNGDDLLPDLALGRLPAQSLEQAETLVHKVLAWENGGFDLGGRAVLIADNPDAEGDFDSDADHAAEILLAAGHEVDRIYLSQLGDGTRPAIAAAFDAGSSLMSYFGHGSVVIWASENLLNTQDVANLAPQEQQPFLLTVNCLNGYFHLPAGNNALAEELLKAEGKGVVGAFSPSSMSQNWAATLYHHAVIEELASGRHERLGDAILAAQVAYAETGARPELLAVYQLLADPALRLE
ncbi:MAG: C25 family cysteine peptidase [Acidobacteria bacterium]|nr:C25 family cysteine peptidase [Acidobacteriota bacterium]